MGKVAEDLEVRAYLTDDNLPVQPQGNTEELKNLDKVAVQVRSRHTETNLGDFTSAQNRLRMARFERELRGASLKVKAAGQEFFAGGGITKGRFQRRSFFGIEGVQGPYELLPARRFNGVIILPGTEAVYLDGRKLRRGSENDYVVDYNRGTVSFTERIPVTADSEIVIDFQSGEDDYDRTTVTGGWRSALAGGDIVLDALYYREGDNQEKPVMGSLTEEEREILRKAGDDPTKAVAPGIVEVEDADDAYLLVTGDTISDHFVFTETGGRYLVNFYEVGSGEGDYVSDGFTRRGEVKYRYMGEGGGNYKVGKPLALPDRNEVFSLGMKGSRGNLFLDMEGNISLYDANIMSGEGDGDNSGKAWELRGGLRNLRIGSSSLSLIGEHSSLEQRFTAPDNPRDTYFYRNWNLDDTPITGTERISGLSLSFEGDRAWQAGMSFKRLTRGGGIDARKGEASLEIGDLTDRGLELAAFESRMESKRDRRYGHVEGAFGFLWLLPRISFDMERYRSFQAAEPDTGRAYVQQIVSIARRGTGKLKGTVSYTGRQTQMMDPTGGGWFDDRENSEIRFDGGYISGDAVIDLIVSRRETRYVQDGGDARFDLARLRYRDTWGMGAIVNDMGYRISSGVDRKLEKAVVFVGENEGNYDENGNEVGDKRGDYTVIFLPAEDLEPVRTVELSWSLSLGRGIRGLSLPGGEGSGFWGLLRRNISIDHFFSVIEKSRSSELLRLYLLDPSLLQSDDHTLYGKSSLRQEWSFLEDVKGYNLRLIALREDEEDNRTEDVSVELLTKDLRLRFEAVPLPALTLTTEGSSGLRERKGEGQAGQTYRVVEISGSQLIGWKLQPSVRLSLELGARHRKDEVSLARQISLFGAPSLEASIGARIHVNALLKLTHTDEKESTGKPLFFLEDGLREDWNVIGQYRFTKFISFGLNYNGHREKDFKGETRTVHALKIESRAYF
jgi:hypothetical protein